MKDFSQETLETGRPRIDAIDGINFCLQNLYADTKKNCDDIVAGCMSYEELIGALLVARDELTQCVAERDELYAQRFEQHQETN